MFIDTKLNKNCKMFCIQTFLLVVKGWQKFLFFQYSVMFCASVFYYFLVLYWFLHPRVLWFSLFDVRFSFSFDFQHLTFPSLLFYFFIYLFIYLFFYFYFYFYFFPYCHCYQPTQNFHGTSNFTCLSLFSIPFLHLHFSVHSIIIFHAFPLT